MIKGKKWKWLHGVLSFSKWFVFSSCCAKYEQNGFMYRCSWLWLLEIAQKPHSEFDTAMLGNTVNQSSQVNVMSWKTGRKLNMCSKFMCIKSDCNVHIMTIIVKNKIMKKKLHTTPKKSQESCCCVSKNWMKVNISIDTFTNVHYY